MNDFRTHQQLLATDNDYRKRLGLGPVPVMTESDASGADVLADLARGGVDRALALLNAKVDPYSDGGVDRRLFERVDQLNQLRLELQRLVEELKAEADECEAQLVDMYVSVGTNEIEYGGRFGKLGSTIWARKVDESVTSEDVAEALRADGLGHLVQPEGYNGSRLSAYLRELDEAGQPIPKHLAAVIEANEVWKVKFSTRRPNRAQQRLAGAQSSVLNGASRA